MTTSPNVLMYAAMDGWRRQMVELGRDTARRPRLTSPTAATRIEAIPGADVLDDELLGAEASHDLDRLQILIDVSATGISGYQAADWLREHEPLDIGLSDHRRILATLSIADDTTTDRPAPRSAEASHHAAGELSEPTPIPFPDPPTSNSRRSSAPATRSSP